MEFMYCIPDLDVFIDSTIKKCLLEFDLERDDTESLLNDIEKVMVQPKDAERKRENDSDKDEKGEDAHHTSQDANANAARIKKLSSTVLEAMQELHMLKAQEGMKTKPRDLMTSLLKDKYSLPDISASVTDMSKLIGSALSDGDQENESRCPSRESKSSSPDLNTDSPKQPGKLKSRLQKRYFQKSREGSPELMEERERKKSASPNSPDSGHVTSSGFDFDLSSSPSPTGQSFRKRSASGDSTFEQARGELSPRIKDENTVSPLEQPSAKIPRLSKYPASANTTSSQKPNDDDNSLFNLYCLAFRSSSDGSVPIETLNRSMHVPMLLKDNLAGSQARTKPGQTEPKEKHQMSAHNSQTTQNPTAQSPKINNNPQRFQALKQRLQQPNYKQKCQGSQVQYTQQEQKKQQCLNDINQEIAEAEKYLGQNSTIFRIIAEELMKVENEQDTILTLSPVDRTVNSNIPKSPSGTRTSKPDLSTKESNCHKHVVSAVTPTSQAPPLIAVNSWPPPPPPLIHHPMPASAQQAVPFTAQQAVPLRAHQSLMSVSRACVVPNRPICLKMHPSPPPTGDDFDNNEPHDLSQKSSRRKTD